MSRDVVLGGQWGDEGKGKVVDLLARAVKIVVRFYGGANAGHTIWVGNTKFVLHVLPSGIIRKGVLNLTGPGVAHDMEVVYEELVLATERGAQVVLDFNAPVVLPLHKQIDQLRESRLGKDKIGTTHRGIGPCYEDMVARRGLKIRDLKSEAAIRRALEHGEYYNSRCKEFDGSEIVPMTLDETVAWVMKRAKVLYMHRGDTREILQRSMAEGKDVLFEGAQGVLLDLMNGTNPFCTSSSTTLGGISQSMGVYEFDRVIAVAKAYLTRVGAGPFPTKLDDEVGQELRDRGHEYGSTTGRPRDCGWLDLFALRYSVRVGGVRELCITKLDVLSGLGALKVCVGYKMAGSDLQRFAHMDRVGDHATLTTELMESCEPLYQELPGWEEDITGCRTFGDLPQNAQFYIRTIEQMTGVPVTMIGVGPDREQLIIRELKVAA